MVPKSKKSGPFISFCSVNVKDSIIVCGISSHSWHGWTSNTPDLIAVYLEIIVFKCLAAQNKCSKIELDVFFYYIGSKIWKYLKSKHYKNLLIIWLNMNFEMWEYLNKAYFDLLFRCASISLLETWDG